MDSLFQTAVEPNMADLMLGPIVDVTTSKLIAVASEQLNLSMELKEELRRFCLTLEMIRGVLQDADEKQVNSHSNLKPWLRELRSVADDADDVLEEIAYENLRRQVVETVHEPKWKEVSHFFTPSNPLAFRLRMAKKIKNLNVFLASINDWATQLGLQQKLVPQLRACHQQIHSFFYPSLFVERKEDVFRVVSLLIDSSNHQDLPLPVIAMVGVAGLGKTTLMKSVCKTNRIRQYFGKIIWIRVSGNFDVDRILREMSEFVTGSVSENISGRSAVLDTIKMGLREKNYLLILDDVRDGQRWKWANLRDCLLGISEIKGMNRVVVTTRSENVALVMGALPENLYRPKPLVAEECWSLIKQRAFGSSSVPLELELIGKEIARKCGGVPLVANLIGGTLHNRRDKDDWQSIEKMNVWNSLERDNGILGILKLSFDSLSEPALKQCFAFCSIFPEDYVMDREMLIQLWIAEGYLQPFEEISITMEDIGNKYFNDLLSYSLLQEDERDSLGNVRTCRMHNLVGDLAMSVSKSEMVILETHSRSNISSVRHLNLICGGEIMRTILGDVGLKLHTLFSKHGFPSDLQMDLKKLRALSFLEASSDAKELPTCFGNSKSLRYLDISGTQIKELPKFFSRLYNLQTFRFMNCKYLKMPLEGMVHLVNLRHIYFSDEERMPAHIGRLTTLQTLQLFFVGRDDGHKIEELGSLNRLKGRLEIHNLELVRDKLEAMTAKLHEKAVNELELKWRQGSSHGDEDVLEGLEPHSNLQKLTIKGYGGKILPSWMSKRSESFSLSNLIELTIRGCRKLKSIPLINGLPSLQLLTVDNCSELTSIDDDGAFAFVSLTKLVIKCCPKLKIVPERGLSSLTELVIEKCDSLECVPISRLSSLQKLHIRLCMVRSSMGDSLSTCLEDLNLYGCPNLGFIPSLEGLASLKNVVIVGCGGLEYLPSGLSSCTALEVLTVSNCDNLICIPKEVQELPSLVELKIELCPKLRTFPEGILDSLGSLKRLSIGPFSKELENFPGLSSINTSLEELRLYGWETLTQLPHQIQHFTALKELQIWNFDKLEALPEWLEKLSSLQRLEIKNCSNLKYLPSAEAIQCLSKLKELQIRYCPELKGRCAKESGPEWSKISHIPNVRMEYDGKGQTIPRAGQSNAK